MPQAKSYSIKEAQEEFKRNSEGFPTLGSTVESLEQHMGTVRQQLPPLVQAVKELQEKEGGIEHILLQVQAARDEAIAARNDAQRAAEAARNRATKVHAHKSYEKRLDALEEHRSPLAGGSPAIARFLRLLAGQLDPLFGEGDEDRRAP